LFNYRWGRYIIESQIIGGKRVDNELVFLGNTLFENKLLIAKKGP